MKRNKIDNQIEKLLLTGLITSTSFIQAIQKIYDPDLIEIPFVDLVAEWCFEYHDEFREAPGKHIQDIFYEKAAKGIDADYQEQIETFLDLLSEQFEEAEAPFNEDYILKKIRLRFQTQSAKLLAEDIKEDLRENKLDDALLRISQFNIPDEMEQSSICPFSDAEAIEKAFLDAPKPLFTFPGALGEFINAQFVRDSLIDFIGPEKRGKTWVLMSVAVRAARCKNNVAFFQVGDMSQSQMVRRIAIHLAQQSDRQIYCGDVPVPILDCQYNQNDECEKDEREDCGFIEWNGHIVDVVKNNLDHVPCTACLGKKAFKATTWYEIRHIKPLTYKKAIEIGTRFHKRLINNRQFKLFTYPNDTFNVADAMNLLDRLELTEGFIPDITIFDYADILAPEPGRMDFRQQVNQTWKALRRLSQEKNCCVVTATQADAASNDQESIGRKNFTEDKRKAGQVTAEYALNQTEWEKRRGIMRIGPIVVREDAFDAKKQVSVLGCLQIGRPFLSSYF